MAKALALDHYRLLGRSGLRVSPLSLGTMTFGENWGWGAEEGEARRIYDAYRDRGGNFIDTANKYTEGQSESLLGQFTKGHRDEVVIATKYSLNTRAKDPNSSGNHRRNMVRAVEDSLRRLKTDYIDLYYLHVWDATTPVEEVLRGFDDLVRSGKIVYAGISDTPAWQVSRMQAIADIRGWSPIVALQIEYNLIERTVERELIPMAKELGLGVIPWSPLASGVLTGKYTKADLAPAALAGALGSRKSVAAAAGSLTERGIGIGEVVKSVAIESGKSPAQVAIAWTLQNPAVTSPIIGARSVAQLEDNLGALDVSFTEEQIARLNAASEIDLGFPHRFLSSEGLRPVLFGETRFEPRA